MIINRHAVNKLMLHGEATNPQVVHGFLRCQAPPFRGSASTASQRQWRHELPPFSAVQCCSWTGGGHSHPPAPQLAQRAAWSECLAEPT